MKKAANCMSLAAFVFYAGGAGGTTIDPSTLTKVVKNQVLNYAFQLHDMPEKCVFWVVDGCRGHAKWHG